MIYLYRVFTFVIYPFQFLIFPFSRKAREFLKKRKIDKDRILQICEDFTSKRVIWLHASSVGELDQCKALISVIRKNEPNTVVIQSVFSESIKEENLRNLDVYFYFRLPLDFYFSYNFIFEKFKPEILILMAWDTWPNLIYAAKKYHSKVFLFCASINKTSGRNSFFLEKLTQSIFQKIDIISASSEFFLPEIFRLVKDKERVFALGDTRVDSVVGKIRTKKKIDPLKKLLPIKNQTIIFASTYPVCEEILVPMISDLLKSGKNVWIFPHHIEKKRIQEIVRLLDINSIPYSLFSEITNKYKKVILFDKLGILAYAYQYAELSYVGGAIHNRVHNVLEPAYFGLPIVTGSRIFHSPEAVSLKNLGGLFSLEKKEDIPEIILKLLKDPKIRSRIKSMNKKFVLSGEGASKRLYGQFIRDIPENKICKI
ncbi:MAG: 3-deoxy-D-manno-octulosonic acid transferase [Leptospiraceae bacterium]|nr:3-deoxy-D-manno-octulosonic acid transferase [Leptospiraceae bacterium]MCK6382466.1 3-deoxy-D-manno-octulosonic acid transferase [Leptospiraceae bacterium]NUM40931.1 3-deoxy-D-manno-octulosonic acid transferase [Leptospiraceae bacterium]